MNKICINDKEITVFVRASVFLKNWLMNYVQNKKNTYSNCPPIYVSQKHYSSCICTQAKKTIRICLIINTALKKVLRYKQWGGFWEKLSFLLGNSLKSDEEGFPHRILMNWPTRRIIFLRIERGVLERRIVTYLILSTP